jgi:hypothetical protein
MATPIAVRNYSSTALPTQISTNIDNQLTTTNIPVVSTSGYPPAPFTGCFERNTINQEFVLVTGVPDGFHFIVVRGYDGTPPVQHLAPATFEHCVGAIDYREANWHHTDTTRDDHLQYVPANGSRPFTAPMSAPGVASNLTGTSGRYVGVTHGAPTGTSVTYQVNDYASDPTNHCFWYCTTAGAPGTWTSSLVLPAARLFASAQTVIGVNAYAQVVSLAQDHAVGGCTTASNAIKLPISGIYRVSCAIMWQTSNNPAGAGRYVAAIFRNGAMVRQYNQYTYGSAFAHPGGSDTGQYAANDLITLYGWQGSSGVEGTYAGSPYTYIAVEFVSMLS